jgi:rhodanese-related sulfurtransferase
MLAPRDDGTAARSPSRWAAAALGATATLAAMELSPDKVKALLDAGEIQLVDVREDYEWEAGRIAGARHIEMERLAGEAATIDRATPVVFSCRVGARSGMAAQAFRASGYDAYNLEGGLLAWADRGLPLEPDGSAYVADH